MRGRGRSWVTVPKQSVPIHIPPRQAPPRRLVPDSYRSVRRRQVIQPGKHLREAVNAVLTEWEDSGQPAREQLRRFDTMLRDGLAWTAAVGDTCRFADAVRAVRTARARLEGANPYQARVALVEVRNVLRPEARNSLCPSVPNQRKAR